MTLESQVLRVPLPNGKEGEHLFTTHVSPRSGWLLLIAPGRGYTCDHPVLHYLRKLALELGYDVLSVRYNFQNSLSRMRSPSDDDLEQELEAAFAALPPHYERICFAGKSLGTPLAVSAAKRHRAADTRLILLTPIMPKLETEDFPTLAVIGTDDFYYSPELVSDNPHVRWHVYDGLNHGLETKEWRGSLTILAELMAALETFLKE
jgi:hypothetical protein